MLLNKSDSTAIFGCEPDGLVSAVSYGYCFNMSKDNGYFLVMLVKDIRFLNHNYSRTMFVFQIT